MCPDIEVDQVLRQGLQGDMVMQRSSEHVGRVGWCSDQCTYMTPEGAGALGDDM